MRNGWRFKRVPQFSILAATVTIKRDKEEDAKNQK